jgi:hypothetical protein
VLRLRMARMIFHDLSANRLSLRRGARYPT